MDKLCAKCRIKLGYKRKDNGFHTAALSKCDKCNKIKAILPARHFKKD